MNKDKVVPMRRAASDQQGREALISVGPAAAMKLREIDLEQARLAARMAPKLAEAEAELDCRRAVFASGYRRLAEAERRATELGIGEDAAPVGAWKMALAYLAVVGFEFMMAVLSMQAITV